MPPKCLENFCPLFGSWITLFIDKSCYLNLRENRPIPVRIFILPIFNHSFEKLKPPTNIQSLAINGMSKRGISVSPPTPSSLAQIMAMPITGKRVSGPLDEELVRARDWHSIRSTGSGSEHEGEGASSSSLSGLVCGFFEPDEPSTAIDDDRRREEADRDEDCGVANGAEALQDVLDPFRKPDERLRLRLYSDVMKTSEALTWLRSSGSGYRRAVMARLREHGYNAGVCKAKWEGSGALTAGNYEYVDVVINGSERYIVDLGLSAEFEIARPTEEYEKLMAVMPKVMVGRAEEVKQVVRIMSEAARRSMKRRGLTVPPWRKSRYMVAKWLGPYRRTVNPLPTSSGASPAAGKREVKCRTVGFNAAGPPRAGAIVLRN